MDALYILLVALLFQWLFIVERIRNMKELRIIISGGRDFNDYELLKNSVKKIIASKTKFPTYITIITGMARGADMLGGAFAVEMGLKIVNFRANWTLYGKRAGFLRNVEMANFAVQDDSTGILIAFWDGKSKGTKHMIDTARRYGLEVHVINYNN